MLHDLAERAEMSIAQLAFSYIRDMEGITSIVFGAVDNGQIKQNIDFLQGRAISADIQELIEVLFADVPEEVITPGLWSSK
jgi:aryl-alcohol dehydrogenase-like predicted oxidoreductase